MALTLSTRAQSAQTQTNKNPVLIFDIDGVPTLYGTTVIKEIVRIGDEGLEIGDPTSDPDAFFIGGLKAITNQKQYLSFEGTTTQIKQQLEIEKGQGSSISSFNIRLIDVDEEITQLVSRGQVVDDILGRKCRVWFGLDANLSFPEDFNILFRGRIIEATPGAGYVDFKLNHPDNKKNAEIYKRIETELDGAINDTTTTINLSSTDDLLFPVTGPDGSIDSGFESFIQIDQEIIKYTGVSGTTLTGVQRAQLSTLASSHDDDASVSTIYRFNENAMLLALKLMASGFQGDYVTGVELTSFNFTSPTTSIPNILYFRDIDIRTLHNPTVGDFVSVTGSLNPGTNDIALKEITDIVSTDDGVYLTIDGVSFTDEIDTTATVSFRSQYDVYPSGFKMTNDEIDIDEHLRLFRLFLSNVEYDFREFETIEGKEFIEQQIYAPAACFSIPRKSRASVGYTIGPIPGQGIKILSDVNVKNASKIKVKRSTSRYFNNEIVYQVDFDVLTERFVNNFVRINSTSQAEIESAPRTLTISSRGLRTENQGQIIALSQSNRRLDRYAFAAETVGVEVLFSAGFDVEIGDITLLAGSSLQLSDTKNASRNFEDRLMQVVNKSVNIKTGNITLELLDTNFDGAARFCLISPSSNIKSGVSASQFIIEESFASIFGVNEFRKWNNFTLPGVRVRNADFSKNDSTVIQQVNGNTITVSPPLSTTPVAGDVLEFDIFSNCTNEQTLVFGFMNDVAFPDGSDQYNML